MKRSICLATALLALLPSLSFAENSERSAPYFEVLSESASLPLKESTADVTIAGIVAHVRLRQRYVNDGDAPIEARYVFPASTRSAIFAMRITHGGRTIAARISPREEAARVYEAARKEGKTAALLEQHRPNVVEMAVANIEPRGTVLVEVDYTELVVPDDGKYELVIPGVVGPRHAKKGEAWTANPTVRAGVDVPLDRWRVDVKISAGMPIHHVASTSHDVKTWLAPGKWEAEIHVEDVKMADRDFVLEYWLAGGAIQTGMLVSPDDDGKGGHFLVLVEPPARVAAREIASREYVFVIDVSGSMDGFPLETAKVLIGELLSGLRPQDRFNLLLFSGGNAAFAETSVPATPERIAEATAFLAGQNGSGWTQLLPALRRALAMPKEVDSRAFVVITDGLVDVEPEAFRLVRENLGKANLFAFGIGSSVNRHLIEGLARAGRAEPFIVEDAGVAAGKAADFRRYVSSPLLTSARVTFDGFETYDVEPVAVPDLFAQRPIAVFGKYRGSARGKVRLSGTTPKGFFVRELAPAGTVVRGPALRQLWARERIATLELVEPRPGQNDAAIEAIGMEYGLLTRRTSFVVVDEKAPRVKGKSDGAKQPVPLPAGVPESAVGTQAAHTQLSNRLVTGVEIQPSELEVPVAMMSAEEIAEPSANALAGLQGASELEGPVSRPAEVLFHDPTYLPTSEGIEERSSVAPEPIEGSYTIVPGPVIDWNAQGQRTQARESLAKLVPTHTYLLPLKHATTTGMTKMLEPFLSREGRIIADERTNTLLIQDHAEQLNRIRELARSIDVPSWEVSATPAKIPLVELLTVDGDRNVRSVVEFNLMQVRYWWGLSFGRNPREGTVEIRLTIDASGRVTSAKVAGGTLATDADLANALVEHFSGLTFAAHASEATIELRFTSE